MIYSPKHFIINDRAREIEFIESNAFATILSCENSAIINISKIPLLIKSEGDALFLEGHFSRSNPHWEKIQCSSSVTVLFDGPHDYISPLWYGDPSKSVPTWNYSTVIVDGIAEIIESPEWLMNSVMKLTAKFEKTNSWQISVEKDYLSNLSKAIIGIKIEIKGLQSKFKLSQNKSESDRNSVIEILSVTNPKLANQMRKL